MGTIRRRAAAATAVMCMFAAALVTGTVAPAGGDVFPSNCRGGDADTRALLGTSTVPIPVDVDGTVPATLEPGVGSVPVEFNWSLEIDGGNEEFADLWLIVADDSVTVEILDLTLPMLVSGSGTTATDVTGTPPDRSITLVRGEKTLVTGGPFTADIPITGSGGDQVFFAVGEPRFGFRVTLPALNNLPLDLALTCKVGRLFAVTTITVEGAPTVDSLAEQVDKGGSLTVDVNDLVAEGDGPLLPGSLEISEPPSSGTASLSDAGVLTYDAPDEDGEVWIGLRVCGEGPEPSDPLCGAGTVKITVGTGVPGGPPPARPPTGTPMPGTPTPGVQATDQQPAPAPASAPPAPAVTGQPRFTG